MCADKLPSISPSPPPPTSSEKVQLSSSYLTDSSTTSSSSSSSPPASPSQSFRTDNNNIKSHSNNNQNNSQIQFSSENANNLHHRTLVANEQSEIERKNIFDTYRITTNNNTNNNNNSNSGSKRSSTEIEIKIIATTPEPIEKNQTFRYVDPNRSSADCDENARINTDVTVVDVDDGEDFNDIILDDNNNRKRILSNVAIENNRKEVENSDEIEVKQSEQLIIYGEKNRSGTNNGLNLIDEELRNETNRSRSSPTSLPLLSSSSSSSLSLTKSTASVAALTKKMMLMIMNNDDNRTATNNKIHIESDDEFIDAEKTSVYENNGKYSEKLKSNNENEIVANRSKSIDEIKQKLTKKLFPTNIDADREEISKSNNDDNLNRCEVNFFELDHHKIIDYPIAPSTVETIPIVTRTISSGNNLKTKPETHSIDNSETKMSNIVNGLTTFNRNYNDSFDNSRRSSIMSMTKKMIDLNQLQSVSRSKSSSRSIVSNRIDADDSIEENRSNHRNNLPPDSIHNEIDDRDLQIDDGYAQQNSLSNDQNDHDAKNVPNQNDTDATDCGLKTSHSHWSAKILSLIKATDEIKISGGSEFGQMIYFADNEDIILEIDGKVVTGFTSYDVERFLEGNSSHELKILNDHQSLPIDLRKYLSQRFARSSIDHNLQGMIRENIYAKTLPVTTRPMRAGEIDGVDYHFINQKQFIEMERSGLLLESGVYRGYYYGTPFPPRRNEQSISNIVEEKKTISNDDQINDALSNGGSKRKRNRSNNVAIDAASLPPGWERITDSHYGVYYIDHINKRTQYERPYEIELVKGVSGFGFTLIEIDKGLIVVKSLIQGGSAATTGVIQSGDVLVSVAGISVTGFQHSDIAHLFSTFNVGDKVKVTLARGHQLPINLNDEDYDIINLKIIKGIQGFGFTISEGHNGQKVKKILDIDRCSNLKQDDILLSINGVDLSLMSHLNVVELLKQCAIDVPTEFMVKRKKRFRSKTPNATLQSNAIDSETVSASLTGMIDSNVPMRNCKTPNAEMFQQYPHHQSQSRIVQSQFDLGETVPSSSIRSQQTNEFFDPRNDPRQMIDSRSGHLPMENNQLKLMIMPTANGLQPIAGLSSDNYNNFDPTSTHTYMNQTNIAENSIANINPIKSKSAPTLNEGIDFMQTYSQHPDLINQHSQSQLQRTSPLLMQSIPSINNVYKKNSNIIPQSSSLAMFGNIDIDYEYIEINLMRTENGFGFRIVGGSEDGSNVAIGSIVIGGPAHTDGNLKAGDELVAINGEYVIGASHQKVVQLISQTGNNVHIVVRRKRYLNAYDVVLHRQEYEGFGFVIISCGNCALIGRIIEGSPAHRCQRLHIRDRIVAVNGLDVTNMSHPEIVNRIKESGEILNLRIVPSDCYTCELIRGTNGYGFSIRGGAEFQGMPLFILNIAVNGPASSLLEIGDEILEINDLPTIGMTHEEAVRLISKSVPSVRLRMRHNYGGTEFLCGMMQQTSASDPILNPLINIGYNQSQQISSSQSSFTPTSLLLPRPQPNASLSTTTTTSSSPSPSSHKSPQHCQQ